MYLHEFQSKKLLSFYGVSIPNGFLIKSIDDIPNLLNLFNQDYLVLKSQVHFGGRGKAGGILFVKNNYNELFIKISDILNRKIFLDKDFVVNKILVEEKVFIINEFYFSFSIDRDMDCIILLVSKNGGIDVEENDSFFKYYLDSNLGIMKHDIVSILNIFCLDFSYFNSLNYLLTRAFELFIDNNLLLLEINPLVLTKFGFICLDAKIDIDDNSIFKNKFYKLIFDYDQKNNFEVIAEKSGLSYVALNGVIGCIVNGAGLAMSTMDLINSLGGSPANFLDIGGNADSNSIVSAFNILLANDVVNVIFINIFAGIIRCDIIANSIVNVIKEKNINIPVVVRLVGNMSDVGLSIINNAFLNIDVEYDLLSAVKKVVNYSKV